MIYVWHGDCLEQLDRLKQQDKSVDLTFLDPPFNQGKDYQYFQDDLPEEKYWDWMTQVCQKVYESTTTGGAIYFMQREKNTERVLRCLRESGWTFQNLIIWLKKTSAVPCRKRFGKQYQIIAFATKGKSPRVFHRLRIDPPARPEHKYEREKGVFVTDCWDDIREMTSGYFAGDEAIRNHDGERFHKQQSPVALLLRILLSSTRPGDWVLDPFAGTGTTAVVSDQLGRHGIAIEIDPNNVQMIRSRLETQRKADSVLKWYHYYRFTDDLPSVWSVELTENWQDKKQMALFEHGVTYGDI